MFAAQRTNTAGEKPPRSPEAEAFLSKMRSVSAIQAKAATDLAFAKREVAIGKLGPDDLKNVFRLLRSTVIPATGLSCMSDIFDRTSEDRGWDRSVSFANACLSDATNEADKARIQSINEWHELIKLLKEPFASITAVIDEGLQHVAITLQLTRNPKSSLAEDDREASGDTPRPGYEEFAAYFKRRAEVFQESKKVMLRGWCRMHDIELPDDFFSNPCSKDFDIPSWMNAGHFTEARKRLRRQLMIMLYIEFLLYSISRRTYDLILYADGLRDCGKLSHTRLIVPGYKRLRKWFYSALWLKQDMSADDFADGMITPLTRTC